MHSRHEYILRRATRGASVNVRIFLEDEGPWTSRKGEDKKMELAEHFEGKKGNRSCSVVRLTLRNDRRSWFSRPIRLLLVRDRLIRQPSRPRFSVSKSGQGKKERVKSSSVLLRLFL